jgi:hypothetical protein
MQSMHLLEEVPKSIQLDLDADGITALLMEGYEDHHQQQQKHLHHHHLYAKAHLQ